MGCGGTHLIAQHLGGKKQDDCEFKASLGYVVRLCLKNPIEGLGRWLCPLTTRAPMPLRILSVTIPWFHGPDMLTFTYGLQVGERTGDICLSGSGLKISSASICLQTL